MADVRTAASEALRVEKVSKHYGDRRAVHEVSFTAAAGELIAIIGPNGAGKTTLLQMLAGSLPVTGGVVVSEHAIGWVPQQAAVYGKLSVAENLKLFARLEKVSDVDATVERMLEQTGLRERARDEVSRLSGGNRQRLNIAVGLLSEPPIVLLDEPSSSLDPRQREVLWDFVGGLAERGTTVVYSTHNVGEAEHYADRVLVLADGELLFTGTPAELRESAPSSREGHFEAAFVGFLHARGH
ncbi:MAG: ABC transporter ATP-binding protein [Solirubrobacteraceae bacterium]